MFQLALSSWSLHSEFLNAPVTKLDACGFARRAKEAFRVRFVEFYEGDYAAGSSVEELGLAYTKEVRNYCDRVGVSVVCIAAINDLATEEEELAAQDHERLLRWADHCEVLGCPIIRINTGRRPLTWERAARLAERLGKLAGRLRGRPVKLAIENHPHALQSDDNTERFLSVLDQVGRDNVGACPDVGAMGPGYWKRGLDRLAPRALHVHLKPEVLGPASPDGRPTEVPLEDYGPVARRILEACGYSGAISLEFTEFRDLNVNSTNAVRGLLEKAARAFGQALEPPGRAAPTPAPAGAAPTCKVNTDPRVTPAEGVLELLAAGLEYKLQAPVCIHDFATQMNIPSPGATHHRRPQTPPAPLNPFCALVQEDATASQACRRFHQDRLQRIKTGAQTQSSLSLCPMGLMVLSVPVGDAANLYGALTTGAWVEQGTEGMIIHGTLSHTTADDAKRREMLEASYQVPAYSLESLRKSQELLNSLAHNLSVLYKRRHDEGMQTLLATDILAEVRGVAEDRSLEKLRQHLPKLFKRFVEIVGRGTIGLYERQEASHVHLYTCQAQTGDNLLPEALNFSAPGDGGLVPLTGEAWLRQLQVQIPLLRFPTNPTSRHAFLVFAAPHSAPLPENIGSLIDQFAAELELLISNFHMLQESERRQRELEVFIDRVKHSFNRPLQGLSDRTQELGDLLNEGKPSKASMDALVKEQLGFIQEAGNIVKRFAGRVRARGLAQLRPQYLRRPVNVGRILEQSKRRFLTGAAKRNISFRGANFELGLNPMWCDPDAFAELFDNLLENALKFAHAGTMINLSVHESKAVSTPPWDLSVPGVRFTIADYGLGIPEDQLERIFEPYVQANVPDVTRVITGTGLGLAICKEIVEVHGGMIRSRCEIPKWNQAKPFPYNLQGCTVEFLIDLPG